MSKSKFFIVFSLTTALSGAMAFAGDFEVDTNAVKVEKPPVAGGVTQPVERVSISWEDLKERCLHPEQSNSQRALQNIKLQCADTTVEFVPAAAGQIALSGSRRIVGTVLSDKFQSAAGTFPVAVQPKGGSCLRFKEVEKKVAVEKPTSCNEILNQNGDIGQFCKASLDQIKGTNPRFTQVRETGKIIDTCSSVSTVGGGSSEDNTDGGSTVGAGDSAGAGGAGADR